MVGSFQVLYPFGFQEYIFTVPPFQEDDHWFIKRLCIRVGPCTATKWPSAETQVAWYFRGSSLKLILHKFPTGDLPVEQAAQLVEFKDDLDLLETELIPHQHLAADKVGPALFIIFLAGLIINVNLSMDDFTAAFALHCENVKLARVGRPGCDKFLKEIHVRSPGWIIL
jgi:hypothetical protein